MKDLKLQLESYLYLINKLYGENEKRDNRIKNKFANRYTNGMLIENNDFELSIKEIIDLWEQGIHTTGCCCGHGDINEAFIGVNFEDIPKMKELGYDVQFNSCRPNDEDSFIPKTELKYGEIEKGFDWWEENNDR